MIQQYTQKLEDTLCSKSEFAATLPQAQKIIRKIRQQTSAGELPLFDVQFQSTEIDEINKTAKYIRKNFTNLVVLGTGGSTLTGQAIVGLRDIENNLGLLPTKIHFIDNIDPDTISLLLENLDINKTMFLAISKSGGTLETLTEFALSVAKVSEVVGQKNIHKHFMVISDNEDNIMRRISSSLNIPIFNHVKKIGGRFSILTNVALLPAAVAGLDISLICKGASNVVADIFAQQQDNDAEPNSLSAPISGAILNYIMMQKGVLSTVCMQYIDKLCPFNVWVRQIWAESLGKNGLGSTYIDANGTIDQHSQQQLYLDGPRDKLFTFITQNTIGKGDYILPIFLDDADVDYTHNKTSGDVISASAQGVMQTFIAKKLPVRKITIDTVNEETLGALIMHFILETVITAELLGVNPFDQPAVEDSKNCTKETLRNMV